MTVAVILATGGADDPPGPPGAPLCARLAMVNVPDVHVIGRPGADVVGPTGGGSVAESPDVAGDLRRIARLARRANVPVVILPADLIIGTGLLDRFVNRTGAPLAAVTVPPGASGGYGTASAQVRKGRVVHMGQGSKTNAAFPGVLRFGASEGVAIAELAEMLADMAGEGAQGDAAGLLLAGLVRSGRTVAARPADGEVCRRISRYESGSAESQKVQDALDASDARFEDRSRLAASVKSDDGFFATFAVSPYSPHLVRWLAGRDVTPNTVTTISVVLALLAALWFTAGTRAGMVTGAVLLYLAFVLDVVDGQLARYTDAATELGAWLNGVCGRGKEYVVYLGLAAGSTLAAADSTVHGGDVWALAVVALVVLTVRYLTDASYQTRVQATPAPALSRARALYWAKKALVLQAGERVALIALTAALFNARVTFLALLTWSAIATAYTLTGRIWRVVKVAA